MFPNQPGAGGQPGPDAALLAGGVLAFVCGFLVVALAVVIFFLLTLSRCLAKCSRRNRTMEPGQVWLNLIPCFNIVWQFITLSRVTESLRNEFRDRGLRSGDPNFGQAIGLAALLLNIAGNFMSRAADKVDNLALNLVSVGVGLAGLVCFIVYWVKVAGFSRQLDTDRGDDGRDEYDDEPRGRRRRYDDEDDDRGRRRSDD